MSKKTIKIVVITTGFWFFVSTVVPKLLTVFDLPLDCIDEEIMSESNPSSDLVAVYYERSCNAITSYEPMVSLRRGPDGKNINIFMPQVTSPLALEWINKSILKITTPTGSRRLRVVKMDGIEIRYYDSYYPHKQF